MTVSRLMVVDDDLEVHRLVRTILKRGEYAIQAFFSPLQALESARGLPPAAALRAELAVLRSAARVLGAVRLPECVVYSTVEPCFMCAGALVHARVRGLVFAVRDPKFGACVSLGRVLDHPMANHRLEFREGVLAEEARRLLQEFFRARRGASEPGVD